LSPGLEFLRRVGVIPLASEMAQESALEVIERQFRCYLLVERGLAEVSAETYVVRARPFLADAQTDHDCVVPDPSRASGFFLATTSLTVSGLTIVNQDGPPVAPPDPAPARRLPPTVLVTGPACRS